MLLDQLRPQFAWLEAMLVDGRAYLCGEHPTLVDCSAHHLCWFISSNVSDDDAAARRVAEAARVDATHGAHRSRPAHAS